MGNSSAILIRARSRVDSLKLIKMLQANLFGLLYFATSSLANPSCAVVKSLTNLGDCIPNSQCSLQCNIVNEQACATVNRQACTTVNQQECTTTVEEQCINVPQTTNEQ